MAKLILDKVYKHGHSRRFLTSFCSTLKKAIDNEADFTVLKDKIIELGGNIMFSSNAGVIITTGPFDNYEVTITYLYEDSGIYHGVYRLDFHLLKHTVFVGEAHKVQA